MLDPGGAGGSMNLSLPGWLSPFVNDTILRECLRCGAGNRVPGKHLADTGRCGACKAELPPVAEPLDVDGATFETIVASAQVPVLVDFWARWCPPCRLAAPGVKKTAAKMSGRAIVLKVDTDQNPELAARFEVRGIPNFVVLKEGQIVSQQAGWAGAGQLQRWLEEAASD
jgi:thioredoxin 2